MFTLPLSRQVLLACTGMALTPCLSAESLFDGTGQPSRQPAPFVVKISAVSGESAGSPTWVVFSGGTDFVVNGTTSDGKSASGPARFIFVTESGIVAGWAPNLDTSKAFVAKDRSAEHAVYKGVALSGNGTTHLLYATDFHNARVDVFDGHFDLMTLPAGAFKDSEIPAGYAPFGIQAVGGHIVVTYAQQDAARHDDVKGSGFGFVDIFDPNGKLVRRFIRHGALNAPWGVALAPSSFGRFDDAVLIGNFGDGTIKASSAHAPPRQSDSAGGGRVSATLV